MTNFSDYLNDYLEGGQDSGWLELHRLRYGDGSGSEADVRAGCLARLYRGFTGCGYSLVSAGDGLMASDLLVLLLLHFRYLTAEQAMMLMPFHSPDLLKVYKGRQSRMGGRYFDSTIYEGRNCVYTLTPELYDAYLAFFPEDYIHSTGILSYSRTMKRSTLLHDVSMCDVPYGCLSQGFSEPLRWFCYVPLCPGISPSESVGTFSDASGGPAPDGAIVPDAIMAFDSSCVLVEQDMCTERASVLTRKFEAYGDYLASVGGTFDSIQILFNVSASRTAGSVRVRGSDTLKKLKVYADGLGNANLQYLYEKLSSSGDGPGGGLARSMRSLIEKYVPERDDRLTATVSSLEARLARVRADAEAVNGREHARRLSDRVRVIRKAFVAFLESGTEAANRFRTAIWKGLSFVITDDYRTYCRYFSPVESGAYETFLEAVRKKYSGTSLTPLFMKGATVTAGQSEYTFRNCILFRRPDNRNHPLIYTFTEITYDVASRYFMSDYLRSYDRNDIENHCILVVRDEKDAAAFYSETGCAGKYVRDDEVFSVLSAFNLAVRFYSMDTGGYFVMTGTGKAYRITETEI